MRSALPRNSIPASIWLLYGLAFLYFVLTLSKAGFRDDINYWIAWAGYIDAGQLGEIYEKKGAEYPPVWLYCIYLFERVMGSVEEVRAHVEYLKVFPLLFDFAAAIAAVALIRRTEFRWAVPFLLLFNIAYLYDTTIWAQIDGIHCGLIAIGLILVLKDRNVLGAIFFILAFNTKLQSIIFLPVFGLLLLPKMLRSPRLALKLILAVVATQLVVLLPFIIGGSVDAYGANILKMDGRLPFVSMHAYNLWYYFVDVDPLTLRDDQIWLLGLTYKTVGKTLFWLIGFVALLPLCRYAWRAYTRTLPPKFDLVALSCLTGVAVTLVFFYFLTEMHERYVHPAIVLCFYYSLRRRHYLLYVLISVAYFLNLEGLLKHFELANYNTLVFDPRFVASVYLFILGMVFFDLFYRYWRELGRNAAVPTAS